MRRMEIEMTSQLLHGELIRLCAINTETDMEPMARWYLDAEYSLLSDSSPAQMYSAKQIKEHLEKEMAQESLTRFDFTIRALADDRLLGSIELDGIRWNQGDAFVGIGIGDRNDWGKGYGTDAMRIIVRFAFMELNLHRVSLDTFEYNPRALRSYQKVGFKIEGRQRRLLNRDGRRWDLIYMGILREEWESMMRDK